MHLSYFVAIKRDKEEAISHEQLSDDGEDVEEQNMFIHITGR